MRLLTYASFALVFALGLFLAIWLMPLPALAQDGGTIVAIPWGDWLIAILANSGEIIIAIAGIALTRLLLILPKPIADFIKTLRVEQFLERAVDYGISATSGAAKGKVLTVQTGSEVVALAVNYVIDKAPAALVRWMGGVERIREMILARLDIAPEASGGVVLHKSAELGSLR